MKRLRPGFTIIEVVVSVVILSVAIMYVLQIHSSNHEQIIYISERNKHALEDSLYLGTETLRHHKEEKNAYELLSKEIKIKEFKSRDILKNTQREIIVPEQRYILPPSEIQGPTALANEIKLKGKYQSNYWHFKLEGI